MKVLMLNGSPHAKGNTSIALDEMRKIFEQEGIEVEEILVGNKDVRGCIACHSCYEKGECVFDDIVNEIAPKFEECEGLVVASPVYYASANGTLISLLDRLFYSTHFEKRMKVGASVVVARRGGLSATFDELNKYFYHLRYAGGFQPVLEQCPWQRAGGGKRRRRRTSDHAYPGPEYGVSDEEHCAGKRKIRTSRAGNTAAYEFYPLME